MTIELSPVQRLAGLTMLLNGTGASFQLPFLSRLQQQSLSLSSWAQLQDPLRILPIPPTSPRSQPLLGHCELCLRRCTVNPESQIRTVSCRGSWATPLESQAGTLENHRTQSEKQGLCHGQTPPEVLSQTMEVYYFSISFAQEINFYKVIDYILHGKEDIKVIP